MGNISNNKGDIIDKLVGVSMWIVYLVFVAFIISAFLLVYVNAGDVVNRVEIYVRVLSSIAAILVMGVFFERYHYYHTSVVMDQSFRHLKTISLCLAAAGIIKVAISVYYGLLCLSGRNLVGLFYFGEILVWSAVSIFAFLYYKRLS